MMEEGRLENLIGANLSLSTFILSLHLHHQSYSHSIFQKEISETISPLGNHLTLRMCN